MNTLRPVIASNGVTYFQMASCIRKAHHGGRMKDRRKGWESPFFQLYNFGTVVGVCVCISVAYEIHLKVAYLHEFMEVL